MKTNLNLDEIRIAAPCNARWEDMTGDERARFCGHCSKNVFDLSAMTRPEIESLIHRTEGKFCGRFYRRPDGRMLTADCPTGRRRRNRLARWCGSAFASVLLFLGVRVSLQAKDTNEIRVLMGEVPARMGDIAAPPLMGIVAPPTNPPVIKTNSPVEPRHEIMGRTALSPITNPPAPQK